MRKFVLSGKFLLAASLLGCGHTPPGAEPVSTSIPPPSCSVGRDGVATDHSLATNAALTMLRQGGNAVDAAVAASFTLSVVRPFACGIGGGGFMLIHLAATPTSPAQDFALNYRETCPSGVSAVTFASLDPAATASQHGGLAVATPGTVKGLLEAHGRFGKLPLRTILQPAIDAAEAGFAADEAFMRSVKAITPLFTDRPEFQQKFAWCWTNMLGAGSRQLGDHLRNPEQAHALRLIAERGVDGFYSGPIADAIAQSVKRNNGLLGISDLKSYNVIWAQPLVGRVSSCSLTTMPPPSSGGIALLQMADGVNRLNQTVDSNRYMIGLCESMKFAFADRAAYLADPDFAPVPTAGLLDPSRLEARANQLVPDLTRPPEFYTSASPLPHDSGTSHISVIDRAGNAVACTETINLQFGSLVVVEGFGFLLNNQMDDFSTGPAPNAFNLVQSDRNRPVPGKRPLSSMTPIIVTEDGNARLVAGGAGGPRIITGTTQVVLNHLVHGIPIAQAVALPRFHHQWRPNEVAVEVAARQEELVRTLQAHGHHVVPTDFIGGINAVSRSREGTIEAAADGRRQGAAGTSAPLDNPNERIR